VERRFVGRGQVMSVVAKRRLDSHALVAHARIRTRLVLEILDVDDGRIDLQRFCRVGRRIVRRHRIGLGFFAHGQAWARGRARKHQRSPHGRVGGRGTREKHEIGQWFARLRSQIATLETFDLLRTMQVRPQIATSIQPVAGTCR